MLSALVIAATSFGPHLLPQAVCSKHAYCCPDAKRCLFPTNQTCANGDACADGQVCCPLTKICVIPGAKCKSPCKSSNAYCGGGLRHCLQTTNPGTHCSSGCAGGETCSIITKLCSKLQEPCKPPEGEAACQNFQYCSPGTNSCLAPSKQRCAKDACAHGQVCDPITKTCATQADACESPCHDPGAYCNPTILSCVKPTKPGVSCKLPTDCNPGEYCDPLVFTCVQAFEPCMPPVKNATA